MKVFWAKLERHQSLLCEIYSIVDFLLLTCGKNTFIRKWRQYWSHWLGSGKMMRPPNDSAVVPKNRIPVPSWSGRGMMEEGLKKACEIFRSIYLI